MSPLAACSGLVLPQCWAPPRPPPCMPCRKVSKHASQLLPCPGSPGTSRSQRSHKTMTPHTSHPPTRNDDAALLSRSPLFFFFHTYRTLPSAVLLLGVPAQIWARTPRWTAPSPEQARACRALQPRPPPRALSAPPAPLCGPSLRLTGGG